MAKPQNLFLASSTLLVAAALGGCIDSAPTQPSPPTRGTSYEMVPVAKVRSHTGTTVEIYEASATGYFAVEYGAGSLPRALGKDDVRTMSAAELYRKATASAEVPAAVAELSERVEAADREEVTPTVAGRIAGTSLDALQHPITALPATSGSCSATWFRDQGYCPSNDGSPRNWCLLNWWNGAYEYGSTDLTYAYLCADIGSVVWEVTNGDGGDHTWTLLQGDLLWYSLHDTWGTWIHYDVTHATNNRFQFGGEMY
jgi:hypothetical protein